MLRNRDCSFQHLSIRWTSARVLQRGPASVLVSQIVPPEFAFEALMHDAAEAYCQDIPAPLKALLPDYQRMETYVDGLIRFKFGISLEQAAVVKYAV